MWNIWETFLQPVPGATDPSDTIQPAATSSICFLPLALQGHLFLSSAPNYSIKNSLLVIFKLPFVKRDKRKSFSNGVEPTNDPPPPPRRVNYDHIQHVSRLC